jgi:hypothetical protein
MQVTEMFNQWAQSIEDTNEYNFSSNDDGKTWTTTATSSAVNIPYTATSSSANITWIPNGTTNNPNWTGSGINTGGWTSQPIYIPGGTVTAPYSWPTTTATINYPGLNTVILDKDDVGIFSLKGNKLVIRMKDGKTVEIADLDDADEKIVARLKVIVAKKELLSA